jgi:hypothetical protein
MINNHQPSTQSPNQGSKQSTQARPQNRRINSSNNNISSSSSSQRRTTHVRRFGWGTAGPGRRWGICTPAPCRGSTAVRGPRTGTGPTRARGCRCSPPERRTPGARRKSPWARRSSSPAAGTLRFLRFCRFLCSLVDLGLVVFVVARSLARSLARFLCFPSSLRCCIVVGGSFPVSPHYCTVVAGRTRVCMFLTYLSLVLEDEQEQDSTARGGGGGR